MFQFQRIVEHEDFGILPLHVISNILVEGGHVEVQCTSLIVGIPILQHMFRVRQREDPSFFICLGCFV